MSKMFGGRLSLLQFLGLVIVFAAILILLYEAY